MQMFLALIVFIIVGGVMLNECGLDPEEVARIEADKKAKAEQLAAWKLSYEKFMTNTNRAYVPIEDDAFLRNLDVLKPFHLAVMLDGLNYKNFPVCKSVSAFRFTLSDGVLLRCNSHYDSYIISDARADISSWALLLQRD